MNNSIIAHRYADALYGFASDKSKENTVFSDSLLIRSQLTGSKRGMKFINSPNIKASAKKLFIREIFDKHIDGVTTRFLEFVIDQQRQNLIDDIFRIYEDIYRSKNNIFKVSVTSAVEIDKDKQLIIKELLGKKLGGNIELTNSVDKSIIGGSIIRIGDKMLDSTIATRLKKIEKHLSE
jgi:F-type H+-transporting ATPase subunit delta